jgi:hypothetical protein
MPSLSAFSISFVGLPSQQFASLTSQMEAQPGNTRGVQGPVCFHR